MRSPLRHLDRDAVDKRAIAETRNREVHLPPISTYRWWARRTEAINGAILDAISLDRHGRLLIVDPFAGGGVIPLAAVLRGHQTYAQDLNPWAVAGLAGMLDLPNANDIEAAGGRLREAVAEIIDQAYSTTFSDGTPAELSHTFRVGVASCPDCRNRLRLYPHALVSLRVRRERGKPEAFLACPEGHLFEGLETGGPQICPTCQRVTDPASSYTGRRVITCPHCGAASSLQQLATDGGWTWDVALVERSAGSRRELALPTAAETAAATSAEWKPTLDLGPIPDGQETRVLRRHGFKTWSDLYPARQRVVMEALLHHIDDASDNEATRRAVRLAIYGAAEMAGHLSRWDRYYLKSYEAMAGHRFNFSTFVAEPNVWGARAAGRGSVNRRLGAFVKAAQWMHDKGIGTLTVETAKADGEITAMTWADTRVVEGSSERLLLPDGSADVCLTDPPYHDDVQYGELSLPLRAWAQLPTDDLEGEASVNPTTKQNTAHEEYRNLLTSIFRECRRVLATDGHLIFSYANRDPRAWEDVIGALHDSGFAAAGYSVLHSENETDVVKRDIRACTLDFLIDVVPTTAAVTDTWMPPAIPDGDEGAFLRIVGETFLTIGRADDVDLPALRDRLQKSAFLTAGNVAPGDDEEVTANVA